MTIGGVKYQQDELEKVLSGFLSPQEKKLCRPPKYKQRPVIVLAGPTCCGKTELSLLLAESLCGELVCADSMQVYRDMDIGTAKATPEEQARAPHHLLDIRDVGNPFTVADFYGEARQACEGPEDRGRFHPHGSGRIRNHPTVHCLRSGD